MKRNLRSLFLTVTALLALVPCVNAQTFFNNICSPGSFKVCASAKVFIDGNGDLIIQVWNNNTATTNASDAMAAYGTATGGHHTITAIGLDNLGPLATSPNGLVVLYKDGSGTTQLNSWHLGASDLQVQISSTINGINEGIVGCYDPDAFDGNLNQDHAQTCNSYPNLPYVEFQIAGLTSLNLSNALFEFHSQQVADASCVVTSQNSNPDCLVSASLKASGRDGSVTPEPVTMLLLGTGLAAVGVIRRRRRGRRTTAE